VAQPGPVTCPNCDREVPEGVFCVCCGEVLADDHHRGYAAAPHERWWHPLPVSTIFPHLPRSDMRPFRAALATAIAIVVVLCLFRFFPLALVVSAVAVPLLFLLYLWDVNVYEDKPLPVIALTVLWGLAGGIVLGLVARHVESQASLLGGTNTNHDLIWLGIVLPCIALLVMIAGPLALLPYRRFNDALDGVAFGACSAATLVAAEAITNSADFLHLGFKAAGNVDLWVARLLTLGVALPVLAAGVSAAVCAAFWLRYRCPMRDRNALGPLGHPMITLPVAALALIAAYVTPIYLDQWWTLAVTAVLAAASLLWLRRIIHLGLREESNEKPIGAPVECTNCHRETPAHSFCAECGGSLRALPKRGEEHGRTGPHRTRSRLGTATKVAIFAVFALTAAGLAAAAIALTRPAGSKPACEPGVPCSPSPPVIPVASPHAVTGIFASGTSWTSEYGAGVRYPSIWNKIAETKSSLALGTSFGNGVQVGVGIFVASASTTPQDLLNHQLFVQKDNYLGIERDSSSRDLVLGPEIGFAPAISVLYKATVDQPPSPSEQVEVAFMAARHDNQTVVIEAITNEPPAHDASSPFPSYQAVDLLLDSFQWAPPT
jgi:hypothetical protein